MNKSNIIRYSISFSIGIITAFLICLLKHIFSQTRPSVIFQILSDAFFFVGVFWSGIGLLVVISAGGLFDIMNYGMYLFFNSFRRNIRERKYKNYQEYKESKHGTKRSIAYLLVTGTVFLCISAVLLIFYYQY